MSVIPNSIYGTQLPPEFILKMKHIFVTYLWDMFDTPRRELSFSEDTIYIRKAVWNNRNAIFQNKAVFHWMIEVLFQRPWSLHEIEESIWLENKLREFFCFIMWGLIVCFSPEDLSKFKTESNPSTRIASILVKRLNILMRMYIDEDSDDYEDQLESLEEDFCEKCNERWQELRRRNDPLRAEIARLSKRYPHFILDMRDRLRKEMDQTDTFWKEPESKQEVWDYINGLSEWSEL